MKLVFIASVWGDSSFGRRSMATVPARLLLAELATSHEINCALDFSSWIAHKK
jgi:hypothetical protein